jgi:hypothetical protein
MAGFGFGGSSDFSVQVLLYPRDSLGIQLLQHSWKCMFESSPYIRLSERQRVLSRILGLNSDRTKFGGILSWTRMKEWKYLRFDMVELHIIRVKTFLQ